MESSSSPALVGSFPGLSVFSDGSVSRTLIPDSILPPLPSFINGVASKDLSPHPSSPNIIRIFLPEIALSSSTKLPTIIYFHGGGFIVGSPSSVFADPVCKKLATQGPFVVVSVGYRLAPEHRLPAAFDDCYDGVCWLQQQAAKLGEPTVEPWLDLYADFSACFLMGHSAGGAIVHQVALRALQGGISPLNIRGLILAVPFFGGEARTTSEICNLADAYVTLEKSDACWLMSLPVGADRDHPYSNVVGSGAPQLRAEITPPVLVVAGELDPLHDRQVEYAKVLRDAGIQVTLEEIGGGDHAMMLGEKAEEEMEKVLSFIHLECSKK